MRVDLSEYQAGGYAILKDITPWGLIRSVSKFASRDQLTDDEQQTASEAMLKHLVKEWNVERDDGSPIPIPRLATQEEIDDVDGRIVVRLLAEAYQVVTKSSLDPNSKSASSAS